MPRPKSKRKTSRPPSPPTRQAPKSAKLARLASDTVAQGMDLVGTDRAVDAIALADDFLTSNRAVADVLHLRGYAKVMLERTDDALDDFQKAVKLDPDMPAYRNSLGIAAQMAGDHEQARRQFRRACQLDAINPTYWFNLGNALRDLGTAADAAEAYEAALAHRPDDSEILNNLGIVLRDDGRVEDAVDIFRKARELTPREPRILANLGIALQECADRDPDGEVEALLKAAVAQSSDSERTEPMRALMQLYLSRGKGAPALAVALQLAARAKDDPETQASLAVAMLSAGVTSEAADLAAALHRDHPEDESLATLHVRCLVEAHSYDEAIALTERLLEVAPDNSVFLRWRFEALYRSDRIKQLAQEFKRATDSQLTFPFSGLFQSRLAYSFDDLEQSVAHLQRFVDEAMLDPIILTELGIAQIRAGHLVEGWTNYQHRNFERTGSGSNRPSSGIDEEKYAFMPVPTWRGEPLAGKRLFILAEQGIGDEVLFASCFPELIAESEHCLIECDPRLLPLYRRSFPDATIRPAIKSIDFKIFYRAYAWLAKKDGADLAIYAGDVPLHRRRRPADFDNARAFLTPRPDRVAFWRQRFADIAQGRPLVGISWEGSLIRNDRTMFYQSLEQWAPFLIESGFCLVNLQSRRFEEPIEATRKSHNLEVAYWKDTDLHNDFDEAAAYIAALDAVIAPAVFTAQLAGALGTPTFMPVTGLGWVSCGFRDRIPFYPNLRVFRRPTDSSWESTMQTIVDEMQDTLRARS